MFTNPTPKQQKCFKISHLHGHSCYYRYEMVISDFQCQPLQQSFKYRNTG